MIRIAMIGAGGYAFELITRIWDLPEHYDLIAVSSNPQRQSVGREPCRARGVTVYDNAEQLLAEMQGRCDVMFIPTPIHTHHDLTLKCMAKGFDVFLEKPPVAVIQEHDSLIRQAQASGTRVAVTFQYLYSVVVQQLKRRLCAGEFGPVRRVRSLACWPRDDAYFARSNWAGRIKLNDQWVLDGTINNPHAHVLANALYLATHQQGRMAEPATVQAELYRAHPIDTEDTSSLRILTREGVEIIHNSTLCSSPDVNPLTTTTVIECEQAVIEYQRFKHATVSFRNGASEQLVDETEQRTHMLEDLAQTYASGGQFAGSLEVCRPFTVAVNSAFESAGRIVTIPAEHIDRFVVSDSMKTVIKGIDEFALAAHQDGKLLSEIGAPWAARSPALEVATSYREFPSRGFRG